MKQEFFYEDTVMGCDLTVSLVTHHKEDADAIYVNMRALARAYDEQFSRFLETSELSQLNRAGTLMVSPECMTVLLLGRELYRKTDGAFNPLVSIARFGYDDDISRVLGTERIGGDSTPYDIDFSAVQMSEEGEVILNEGQSIDVGGYLKGYVAEKMVALKGVASGVIVNLGGDIYTEGVDPFGNHFLFEIEHPVTGEVAATFPFKDGGIATSGSYKRHWKHRGKRVHHILDATGRKNPNTDIVSATVIAPRGHEAEGYATAALVMGSDTAAVLLHARGAEYCFVLADGSMTASPRFPLLA